MDKVAPSSEPLTQNSDDSPKRVPCGLTRKACVVQFVSTAVFLPCGIYLLWSRPEAAPPSSLNGVNIQSAIWLIAITLIVEALGQTPLGISGLYSGRPDNSDTDFIDELVHSAEWTPSTSKVVPWCSYICYLCFLVTIPVCRLTIFCWAIGAASWAYILIVLHGCWLLGSWVHVMLTWKQTFITYASLSFFLAPCISGVGLMCAAAFRSSPPASPVGLAIVGLSLFLYFAMYMVYMGGGIKRWHGEIINLPAWVMLTWGAMIL